LAVILAPLPLGSNREWSWTLCSLLISGLALAWSALHLFRPNASNTRFQPALTTGFLLVCTWALIQTSTAIPDGWKHPLYQMSNTIVGANSFANFSASTISLAPDDTLTAAMRLLAYGLVFFLAFQWGKNQRLARRTLQWLIIAGLAYSIYGLAMFWSGSASLFWFEDPGFAHDVRGTFVNRNHFATYAGLVLLCAIALFYQRVVLHSGPPAAMPQPRRLPPGAHVANRVERLEQFALEIWKPLIVILLLSTALILTHSRSGFFSTLLAGGVLLVCFNYRQRIRNRRSILAIGLAVGFALIAFWLTSEVLLQRIDQTRFDNNLRFVAYKVISESTRENPVLGFGYGTFADSFRLYRTDTINAYLDRAHNTYLENAFELGWPVAMLLFSVIGGAFLVCVRGLRNRGRDWIYPAIAIAATMQVTIHSWFDFSLQMPGVAITYACILGVGCAQSYSSRIP
jgi:O-antigen ligase